MSSEPARTAARHRRPTLLAALLVGAAAVGVHQVGAWAAPSPAPSPIAAPPLTPGRLPGNSAVADKADGVVPNGVTVFGGQYPAVARLDPALRSALRRATTAAAARGVRIVVNSGWRSPKYQEQLLLQAISTYGSKEKAARWVASPSTSAHVRGKAVDLGPASATAWLSRHGARYGLCQIYSDEAWHFELRPTAVHDGCPPRYADPTHDPRMR